MKLTFLSIFLLFSLSTHLLLEEAHASSPEQVYSISGGKILIGWTYYVLPVPTFNSVNVGGLALINSTRREQQQPCPLDIVSVETNKGIPVIFNAMDRKQAVVNISTDVNIQFYAPKNNSCPQYSTVWKLDDFDTSTQQWFVTTGGVLGKPGKKTVRIWFKIEKYDDDYKIVYCPTVCKNCKVHQCSDVGVYVDEHENKRLVLSNVPLKLSSVPADLENRAFHIYEIKCVF